MAGRWLLPALAVAFLAALALLRSCSGVLRAEARVAPARAVAAATALDVVDVLALLARHGGDLPQAELEALARRYRALRDELGAEPLAVVALAGHDRLARSLRAAAPADPEAALRAHPAGVEWQRFETLRGRFRERLPR
jgi:hypothetical protein